MSQSFEPNEFEPTPDHLADTGPIQTIHTRPDPIPAWRRAFGLLSLLGAAAFTLGAMAMLLAPVETPVEEPSVITADATDAPLITATPLDQQPEVNPDGEQVQSVTVLPTLAPDAMANILNKPLEPAAVSNTRIVAVRNTYNPFTIIPERTRSEVEHYTIVSGDTIFRIAEVYGLKPETIVWGNDHRLVEGLRPGDVINILPVDGVYHQALGGETIAEVAAEYRVDPYAIIDSEFNDLFGSGPDDPLPEGEWVVVPGGEREQISWNPVVERIPADGSGGQGGISFAPGEQGSCGLVSNPGGTGWVSPLSGYSWIRGFSAVHSGVDLSAPVGTPVAAANGGAVIFSGFSSYGYGYAVVLAHGPFTTLYGHLSAINVGCAQYVSAGSVIGAVGSSGNSSGPHLHFEIRYLDIPQDPTYTMPF